MRGKQKHNVKAGLVYVTIPSNLRSLGYSWGKDGSVERTISINGKVVERETLKAAQRLYHKDFPAVKAK